MLGGHKELYNWGALLSVIIKSRSVSWMGDVACIMELRHSYKN